MGVASESRARRVCWALAVIDLVLGAGAALFPTTYLAIVHPALPAAEYPYDWVVRTGVLWLVFLVFEVSAAVSGAPGKWFFCVGLLRLMEVPADLAYAALARGASAVSTAAIFAAPFLNALAGVYLLLAWRRTEPAALKRQPARPAAPPET